MHIFGLFFLVSISIAFKLSYIWINLAYNVTSCDLDRLNTARRAFITLICGPRSHYPSQCGPCIGLNLRPLLYLLYLEGYE